MSKIKNLFIKNPIDAKALNVPSVINLIVITMTAIITYVIVVQKKIGGDYYVSSSKLARYGGLKTYDTPLEQLTHAYTFISNMFLHASIGHLIANVAMLITLWLICTKYFTTLTLNLVFFGSSIISGMTYIFIIKDAENVIVGMSGGTYGLLGLTFMYIILTTSHKLTNTWHIAIKTLIIMFTLGFLYDAISAIVPFEKENLISANYIHLSSFVVGILLSIIWFYMQNNKQTRTKLKKQPDEKIEHRIHVRT